MKLCPRLIGTALIVTSYINATPPERPVDSGVTVVFKTIEAQYQHGNFLLNVNLLQDQNYKNNDEEARIGSSSQLNKRYHPHDMEKKNHHTAPATNPDPLPLSQENLRKKDTNYHPSTSVYVHASGYGFDLSAPNKVKLGDYQATLIKTEELVKRCGRNITWLKLAEVTCHSPESFKKQNAQILLKYNYAPITPERGDITHPIGGIVEIFGADAAFSLSISDPLTRASESLFSFLGQLYDIIKDPSNVKKFDKKGVYEVPCLPTPDQVKKANEELAFVFADLDFFQLPVNMFIVPTTEKDKCIFGVTFVKMRNQGYDGTIIFGQSFFRQFDVFVNHQNHLLKLAQIPSSEEKNSDFNL